jgi:hypothetical protein
LKIVEAGKPYVTHTVATDEPGYPSYARSGPQAWDKITEHGFEPVRETDDLEQAYQAYLSTQNTEVPLRNFKALRTLDNGFYWLLDTNGTFELVEIRKDGENARVTVCLPAGTTTERRMWLVLLICSSSPFSRVAVHPSG